MSAIPGNIDPDGGPPMTIPLRHFVVGLAFLLLGAVAGTAGAVDVLGPTLVHVHLLLAGWVCVTIMGAMTQFVPVWSGVRLHSRRLATAQLWLVVVGLIGFAGALLAGRAELLPVGGGLMVLGFWTFAYNLGRTLLAARPWDVTERHFALALGFFALLTLLGFSLAVGYTRPIFADLPLDRGGVRMAHVTLAIYGAILTTVLGALYQLATMFTQSELHGIDVPLRRLEEVGYPVGVLVLATGRLFDAAVVGRVGAGLLVLALLGFAVVLARRLYEARVDWTPMLSRYAVVAAALVAWALVTLPAWLSDPLDPAVLYGAPGTVHLLAVGVIGFVVLGTLYHIVPFIVWVHRYSDRLGLEDVPMIDDLYDDRLAAADFALLLAGTGGLVAADLFELPTTVAVGGGASVALGAALFVTNMLLVLRRHSPYDLPGILFARFAVEEEPARDAEVAPGGRS